jgi:hypothetical protein
VNTFLFNDFAYFMISSSILDHTMMKNSPGFIGLLIFLYFGICSVYVAVYLGGEYTY